MGEPVVAQQKRRRRTDAKDELEHILRHELIEPVYQPIVQLDTGRVVAYEALARGPQGSALEMPAALFGAATRHGRLTELDWACRAAAISGAFDADYLPPAALFVNVEPVAAGHSVPRQYEELMKQAQDGLRVVFEFTERSLTDHPGEVLYAVRALRELGALIALDDVGVDPRSLALLPFLEPEVVKLNMSLTHHPLAARSLSTMQAVHAYAEEIGAIVLAEGIETPEHVEAAHGLGATHGQGWHYGRPGPLPHAQTWEAIDIFDAQPHTVVDASQTPFDWLVAHNAPSGHASGETLREIVTHVLHRATSLGPSAVVIASPAYLSNGAHDVILQTLADDLAFVAVLSTSAEGRGPSALRTGTLASGEPLTTEPSYCILSPTFAVAVCATPTERPDTYSYRLSHDRQVVSCAARRLMARVTPVSET